MAAKCQLLFGLAVLVIIAGALAVPWQRMEQLATKPNIKAASFAADLLFREVHAGLVSPSETQPAPPPAQTASASTLPSSSTQPAWDSARLNESDYPPPRIFVVASPKGGLVSPAKRDRSRPSPPQSPPSPPADITAPVPSFPATQSATAADPLALQALRLFREQAQENEYGEVGSFLVRGESKRIYRFAAAIRLDPSCLQCHAQFSDFLPGTSAATATAATRIAASLPATAPALAANTAEGPVVGIVRVDVPYQTDENQLLLNRIVIVVAGMVGGALAIVVFYLITSRLILQPVRVLKNTAEKVAHGDLNIRSAISTGDEFQQLSETFNTMLATLQASQDQLEATNRSLDTRVGELAQSNVDLYEANRLKSEFLTNVTHELRTPLNAIIGFADLMADTAKDPKQQRYSENIRASARQLLELINDLLDLAKIEAGKLVLREEKVSVADVCEAMANFMRPLAQKKSIMLELSVALDMPLIMTDPGRFQQILYNFLSNAIKFTPTEGRVAIIARIEAPPAPASAERCIATGGQPGTDATRCFPNSPTPEQPLPPGRPRDSGHPHLRHRYWAGHFR